MKVMKKNAIIAILLFIASQTLSAEQYFNASEIHIAQTPSSIELPPVYPPAMTADEALLIFTDGAGMVTATSIESDTLWTYEAPGHFKFSPAIGYDGTIYCAGASGSANSSTWLTALNQNGSLKWEVNLESCSISPIAVTPEGMIYIATEDSLIHGINSDSSTLWTCQVEGGYYRELVVGPDGTIYATACFSNDPVIYAINSAGEILWECDLPGAISGSGYLAWGGDVLYYFDYYGVEIDGENIGVSDGLYAINPDGTLRWRRTEPTITTQITVGKDNLYVMGEYATLFVLSKDGTLQWERQLSELNWKSSSIQPIVGENGLLYAADFTSDCFIHAVTSENELLWTQEILVENTILDSNGVLHCFSGLGHETIQTTSMGFDNELIWPCEGGNYQRTYCLMEDNHPIVNSTQSPYAIELLPPYPNPFNPSTTITYSLPEASPVSLAVYSISGQKIATLADERQSAGEHSAMFDSAGLASGLYFARIEAGGMVRTEKMMLVK